MADRPATDLAEPAGKRAGRPLPPGRLRREAAAAYCQVGLSTWDKYTAAGLNPQPITFGGVVGWNRRELNAWLDHGCPPRAEWAPVWKALVAARYTVPGARRR